MAGQESGTRRRADGSRGVGLGEAGAFGGELIQVGRVLILATEATEVIDAEVVGEEDDEVGRGLLRGGRDQREQGAEEQSEEEAGHALGLTSRRVVQRAKPTSVPSWTFV